MELKEYFNYGVPTALLIFLCVGLWRIVIWARSAVVLPLVGSHLDLIKTLQEQGPIQNEKLDAVATAAGRVAENAAKAADAASLAASTVALHQSSQMEGLRQAISMQTDILKSTLESQTVQVKTALLTTCNAKCPSANECQNYNPKG